MTSEFAKLMATSATGALVFVALVGCDSGTRKRPVAAGVNAPPAIVETKLKPEAIAKWRKDKTAEPGLHTTPNFQANNNAGNTTPNDPNKEATAPPGTGNPDANPNGPREKATADATAKDFGGGVIGQPFEVYFKAKDTLEFGKMKQLLDLYKVEHGLPKSHDEFWKKIIVANGIKLPELDPAHVYEYDPKTGDLMVAPAKDN